MRGIQSIGSFKKCDRGSREYYKKIEALMEEYRSKCRAGILMGSTYCTRIVQRRYPVVGELLNNIQRCTEGLFVAKEHSSEVEIVLIEGDAMASMLSEAIERGKVVV